MGAEDRTAAWLAIRRGLVRQIREQRREIKRLSAENDQLRGRKQPTSIRKMKWRI